jgi:hypothetical protein
MCGEVPRAGGKHQGGGVLCHCRECESECECDCESKSEGGKDTSPHCCNGE